MDPITGSSVNPEQKLPEKTAQEESQENSAQRSEDTKAQSEELSKTKQNLESNRPGTSSGRVAENSQEVSTSSNGGALTSLSAWASSVVSPDSFNPLKKVARDLVSDGVALRALGDKEKELSQEDQRANLTEKLKPIIEADKTLTQEEKDQSIASISELVSHLPSGTKEDSDNVRETMRGLFALDEVEKDDRQGHFIELAKSALEASSLNTEQKKKAFSDVVRAASPNLGQGEIDQFARLIQSLPNETTKEKEIFRDAVNKFNDVTSDESLSNLESMTKSFSEILGAFSEYRENAVDDNARQALLNDQQQAMSDLVKLFLDGNELSDNDKDLISKVSGELIMKLNDNPETLDNEIQELLDFSTRATDINFESLGELQDFAIGLSERVGEAYAHLSHDEQVDLISNITTDVLHNFDLAKEYGFNEVERETISEAVSQIFDAVNSEQGIFDDPKMQAEVLKGVNHIVSDLNPENKEKLSSDIVRLAFSADGELTSTEKTLAALSSDLLKGLSEEEVNQLIDFGIGYAHSDASFSDLFANTDILAQKLGLDSKATADAQRLIADIGVKAFQDLASQSGSPLNIANLKALLSPSANGVLGDDGHFDSRDISRISSQVANNILDNPISQEERSANAQAHSQREAQHQAEVRRQAYGKINQKFNGRNGFFARKARSAASSWTPGSRGRGIIRGSTHSRMNSGYYGSKGQAYAQMRQGVFSEAHGRISESLNNPNSQNAINMLSQMLDKSSLPSYAKTGSMRVDDLRSLEALRGVQSKLKPEAISLPGVEDLFAADNLDVNKLLGIKPDIEIERTTDNPEHGHFDIFKDKNNNQEFYRLIKKDNEIKFAIKKDDGKFAYLEGDDYSYGGKSYQDVVDGFKELKPTELELGSQAIKGVDGKTFDMFSNKSTGQEFYRKTDDKGKVSFAIKSKSSETGWAELPKDGKYKGLDYSGLISDFEKQSPRSELAQQRQEEIQEKGTLSISKRMPGANGSEFIHFTDQAGQEFYAIKENNGNIKLRIGNSRSATPISQDYQHNGVDYSWMIKHLE